MANMSEEWRQSIVEGKTGSRASVSPMNVYAEAMGKPDQKSLRPGKHILVMLEKKITGEQIN
jgi:hypothetical protein